MCILVLCHIILLIMTLDKKNFLQVTVPQNITMEAGFLSEV